MKTPANMTSEQLLQGFADLAVKMEAAILVNENARYNLLFDRIKKIEAELKGRDGDERRLLCALYADRGIYVRLQAAVATLDVEPERARQVLREIAGAENYPATAEARMMLLYLERGSFVPE